MFAGATSRLAVRVAACLALTACCLGATGCSLFKQSNKDRNNDTGGGPPPPRFPTSGAPNSSAGGNNVTPTNAVSNPSIQGAVLYGRVVDGYNRPPANTSVRWVCLDDNKETENEVSVMPEGYFSIVGLREGARYKLVARGKQGERLVAGISYATAPNIRVLIQVKDDLPNSGTPPVQGPPVATPQDNPPKTSSLGTKISPSGWAPALNVPAGLGANDPELPVALNVQPQRLTPTSGPPTNEWTPAATSPNPPTWPPTLEMPRINRTAPPLKIPDAAPPTTSNPPAFPANVSDALSQARIPSCVRVGDRIINFALNDVEGQPWELRRRTGKLVLVDFWATYCPPCLKSMPHLRDLQVKFGPQGLEVIGIANEAGGLPQTQAAQVKEMCVRLGVTNYRQLLSTSAECPVRKQFNVRSLPSLFLLDEQGAIIWRAESMPSAEQRDELERLIQRRLAKPL